MELRYQDPTGGAKASQVANMRNPCAKFRIGKWNVKTLLKTGKVEESKQEMKRENLKSKESVKYNGLEMVIFYPKNLELFIVKMRKEEKMVLQ